MAGVKRMSYALTPLADRPGELLRVMQNLKSKNVSLAGLWGFGTEPGKAQLYAIGKSAEKLRSAWKEAGMQVEEGEGFYMSGADRPGALLKPLEALSAGGINIVAIDAVSVGGKFGSFIWVKPTEVERAAGVLGAK